MKRNAEAKQFKPDTASLCEESALHSVDDKAIDFDTSLSDFDWDEIEVGCEQNIDPESRKTGTSSPVLRRKIRRESVKARVLTAFTQSSGSVADDIHLSPNVATFSTTIASCTRAATTATEKAAVCQRPHPADINTDENVCSLPFEHSPRVPLSPAGPSKLSPELVWNSSLPLATPREALTPAAVAQQQEGRLTLSQLRRRALLQKISSPAVRADSCEADASRDDQPVPVQSTPRSTAPAPFHGLPMCVAALLEKQRGIRQLYAWQEECLRLEAVQQRRNLVYSLPTSGGKTLVAELLIMRELVSRRRDCVLVLPYVAIVQEKVRSLAPFAIALGFIVSEYASNRGAYPPPKRKKRRTVYVCTIEKAAGLVVSLVEESRASSELGLVVIDELHMIGDSGRGPALEQLIVILKNATPDVQLVGMSATIGNMHQLCEFMAASCYNRHFRPVQLREYVLLNGQQLLVCDGGDGNIAAENDDLLTPVRHVHFPQYTVEQRRADSDSIGGLVCEVVPKHSCLVFCPTKKNCQAVAKLICSVLPRSLLELNVDNKRALYRALHKESTGEVCSVLSSTLPYGVAYHHSGLTCDERRLLEEAYEEGTLCCLCCTSTLAAGVNLPAKRVIIRSPYTGSAFLSRARYKQMAGRAGRAGIDDSGESILIVQPTDAKKVGELLTSPVEHCRSRLSDNNQHGLRRLVVTAVALQLVQTPRQLRQLLNTTLLAVDATSSCSEQTNSLDTTLAGVLQSLQDDQLIQLLPSTAVKTDTKTAADLSTCCEHGVVWSSDFTVSVSRLCHAAIKGNVDLAVVGRLYSELRRAQSSLSLLTDLHLLYLVTPYDMITEFPPLAHVYLDMYSSLDSDDVQVAQSIGVCERHLVRLMSGAAVTPVVHRFYVTLILHSVLQLGNSAGGGPVGGGGGSLWQAARSLQIQRGQLQQLVAATAAFCSGVLHFSQQLAELWPFAQLLEPLCRRLAVGYTVELLELMQLPAVKLGRARALFSAGYKSLQSVANCDPAELVSLLDHMPRRAAKQIVDSAKMLVLEKAESLQEEVDFILDGLRSVEFHESPGIEQLILSGVNDLNEVNGP